LRDSGVVAEPDGRRADPEAADPAEEIGIDPDAPVGDNGLIIPDANPCDMAKEFEVGGDVLLYPADGLVL
jgi:hypothetical protein